MTRRRPNRAEFPHFETFSTRWRDNDVYGHLNNAVVYEYVDTLVNSWLIRSGALEIPNGPVICLVVETGCSFFAALSFPEPLDAGLRLDRIGAASITYGIGLFRAGAAESTARARFTHVCVDSATRRPVHVPPALRAALAGLASQVQSGT